MLAAPTIFGRPMTIYSAGVGEKKVDFIQDGGKTKKAKEHLSPRSKAYTYHLPPSQPPLFLIGHYL